MFHFRRSQTLIQMGRTVCGGVFVASLPSSIRAFVVAGVASYVDRQTIHVIDIEMESVKERTLKHEQVANHRIDDQMNNGLS